jgi:hypothetical protein
MKPGDLVRVYFDGKGASGEIWDGLVLDAFVDHRAKKNRDNNSRWITGRILVDGRPRIMNLYWDDDYEVLQ